LSTLPRLAGSRWNARSWASPTASQRNPKSQITPPTTHHAGR